MIVWLDKLVADHGSIVVFGGHTDIGHTPVTVSADHRMAQVLADAIEEEGEIEVGVEEYQVSYD